MKKRFSLNYYLVHLILLFLISNITAQKKSFPNGPILNLKAGYHFGDSKSEGYANYGDYSIPAGLIFEISGELPTGKGWYPGFRIEYSAGNDAVYDYYSSGLINRNIYFANFLLTLKKRIYFKNSALYFQSGLGKGTVKSEYDRSLGETEDGVVLFSFSTGFEYIIGYRTMVSLEAGYLGMGQVKFHGSGRSNSLISLKAGIGYVFK